jgi:hypothetical protein
MSVLPESRRDQIIWFQNRLALWATHAAEIGLGDAQVSDLSGLVTAATTALEQAEIARDTARSRTADFHSATDVMRTTGAALIKTIKAFAAASEDSKVYTLANIPEPASPTPAPPPEAPSAVFTTVNNDGSVTLKWMFKNNASSPVSFQIFRKIEGQTTYSLVASTALKSHTDTAITPGTPSISYMVRAIRGKSAGQDSEPVTVYFGYVKTENDGGELQIAA